jgi:hypothetical protein
MREPARLHPDDLTALAEMVAGRVAALLQGESAPALLTAAEVAERYGVSADWVRSNADRLGVVRLGDGARPRLRFPAAAVAEALNASPGSGRSKVSESPAPPANATRRRPTAMGTGVDLLPVRGFNTPPNSKTGGHRANGPALSPENGLQRDSQATPRGRAISPDRPGSGSEERNGT